MPRYKLSPEERAAEKERKDNLRNIMKGLDVKNFDDLKDVFKMMVGEMLENGLDGELDDELGYTKYDYRNKEGENSRNGYSKKTLKTSFGETEIKVPQDRDGEFEPQLVKKNQTTLTGDIEEKIISMYAKGMTTSDIEAHIRDIYGLECSDTTISRITDKILPVVREWHHLKKSMQSYSWMQYTSTSEAKDKLSKRLYISQSESIWKGERKSLECGLAKMRVQSFGFRC